MNFRNSQQVLGCILVITLCAGAGAPTTTAEKSDVVLTTMQQELQRAQSSLGKLDPAPYYLSYSVYDQSVSVVIGAQGGLVNSTNAQRRSADVTMRIGSPALDNSHEQSRPSVDAKRNRVSCAVIRTVEE